MSAPNDTKTYTPKELAAKIGVDPKVLRGHLRATYTRPVEVKNTTWIIPANVATECETFFAKRRAAKLAEVAPVA